MRAGMVAAVGRTVGAGIPSRLRRRRGRGRGRGIEKETKEGQWVLGARVAFRGQVGAFTLWVYWWSLLVIVGHCGSVGGDCW